jgi:ribose/xylose/arabinose/galactoside ABC-type transport system permease subunit
VDPAAEQPASSDAHVLPRPRGSVGGLVGRYLRYSGLLIAIIVLVAIFTALTPPDSFLSLQNGLGLLRSMSTLSILALAATLVIVLGEIDLSFGYVYGLSGMVMAVSWLSWGWPVGASILLAFAVAAGVGVFNAALTTRLGIPSFIVTLGSGALCLGFTLLVGSSRSYNYHAAPVGRALNHPEVTWFATLGGAKLPFDFPAQGLWFIGVGLVFVFLLDRSLFGFRLKAIGGNTAAARVARLPVVRYKTIAFVTLSAAACLTALLDFSFIGSVQPDSGSNLVFPVFSAVIIGGASLVGGVGTTLGTLSGALLLAVMTNGFAVLAVGSWAQQMLVGAITILAVVLDRLTTRR